MESVVLKNRQTKLSGKLMISSIKRIRNIGSLFASSLLVLILFSQGVLAMSNPVYSFSFKTIRSTCILRINDLPTIDNTDSDTGTMSAGYNITPFLENGSSRVELLMGSEDIEDPKTLYTDSSCEVTVYRKENNAERKVASYKLIVDGDGKISVQPVIAEGNDRLNLQEGYTSDKNDHGLYKLTGNFSVNGIPAWQWTNARPVTEQDINQIKMAYAKIAGLINIKDMSELKKLAEISNNEIAISQSASPDFIFQSTGLAGLVADYTVAPIDWSKYKLIKYNSGKLFRLGVGFNQISPLIFVNADGEIQSSYNPYFSIINGKVVQVR